MTDADQSTRAAFLARLDAFLAQSGLSEREIGLSALNTHKAIPKLRDPAQSVTLRTIERLEAFMAAHEAGPPGAEKAA